MKERREFLKLASVFLVTAACNPEKLFGPKPKKFAAWSRTVGQSPFPLQVMTLDARLSRQFTGFEATPAVLTFARQNPGCLYIHNDEPDQSGILPEDYAVLYHDWSAALKTADPKARLSPAGFAEPNPVPGPHSTDYAARFFWAHINTYGFAPQVDEWRFHDFGLDQPGNVGAWWQRVSQAADWSVAHGANMVLGSWGFLNWQEPQSDFLRHMTEAKALIQNDPRINQAVWWSLENTGEPHFLRNDDGSLTPEGEVYAA